MRVAHSNQTKPLNLVDQSQEAGLVVLAVRGVRWVTFGGQPVHSERAARTVVTAAALRPGDDAPDCQGNHPRRSQTRTRRAFGMERSMTCSRSPTYSPSTWNATGRAARKVSTGWSCRGAKCRPTGPL